MTDPDELTDTLLAGGAGRRRTKAKSKTLIPAENLPCAHVTVDLAVPHLDQVFTAMVPESMSAQAQPGHRVKVRMGAQEHFGYVLERSNEKWSENNRLSRVVSTEPVLTPEVARTARAVADHYGGTLADVLQLAIPARHAGAEKAPQYPGVGASSLMPDAGEWTAYRGGPALLQMLSAQRAIGAVWGALGGVDNSGHLHAHRAIVAAAIAPAQVGRGVIVLAPHARDVGLLLNAFAAAGAGAWAPGVPNAGPVARLVSEDPPRVRYENYLAALRGHAPIVVGTRAAVFAPVANLGLIAVWDESDPLYQEPRAPYFHTRDVAVLRAAAQDAAYLVGGFSPSPAALHLETSGAKTLTPLPAALTATRPVIRQATSADVAAETGGPTSRLPSQVHRTVTRALEHGPVLFQVPRAGYIPVVSCSNCREVARCETCYGLISLDSGGAAHCTGCGRLASNWRCSTCRGGQLRAVRVGSGRTAEELGRAFPRTVVRLSGARADGGIISQVPNKPAVIVATPGAEPVCPGGYAAAVILDAEVPSGSTAADAHQQALALWMRAAALVRPGPQGQVLLVGDGAGGPSQALVRWDGAGFAARELAERAALDLPPTVAAVSLIGNAHPVQLVVDRITAELPNLDVFGPQPTAAFAPRVTQEALDDTLFQDWVRVVLRANSANPVSPGKLAAVVKTASALRTMRREPGRVRIQVNPPELW